MLGTTIWGREWLMLMHDHASMGDSVSDDNCTGSAGACDVCVFADAWLG